MKEYEITIKHTETTHVRVTADTQEEAEDLAWEAWYADEGVGGSGTNEIVDVKETI